MVAETVQLAERSALDPAPHGRLLTGWGRTAPTRARVSRVSHARDADRLLAAAGARGLIARGLGRSYGDAAQNAGGEVLDMTSVTGLGLDPDAGRVTVEAGTSLDALMRRLIPRGWFVPVTPGTRYVTVGGAIAADVHGKNHHGDGGFCNFIESFELLTPGEGHLTVTREGMPDVFDATAGGMGLTGVVLRATLRLAPIESAWMKVDTERTADLDDLMARMRASDHRYRYSVAWIDCMATGAHIGRGVLTRADHATLGELEPTKRRRALVFAPRSALPVPPLAPSFLLRRATARLFNEAWFGRAPTIERGRLQPLASYFHPLDGLRDWNRMYGSRGFVQYQFVVPFGEEDVVRTVIERLGASGVPSFLGVLKRFGEGRGMLSFPIPGWTLALDVPAGGAVLSELLDGFDELVEQAGGRVYLAKDSRLRPGLMPAMYPELDRWREVRERLDPGRRMRSDLARRLEL